MHALQRGSQQDGCLNWPSSRPKGFWMEVNICYISHTSSLFEQNLQLKFSNKLLKKCEHCLSAFDETKYVLGKYEYAAWRIHQLRRRSSFASVYTLLSMIELFQSHKQTSWTFSLGSAWSRSTTKKWWVPPPFPIKFFKICKGSCWWLFKKIFQRTRWTEIFWLTWNICIILYTSVVQLSNWKNVNLYE